MTHPSGILNEEIIDDLTAILGDGYKALFQEQLVQAAVYIKNIQELMDKNESAGIGRLAHALKSSAGQVGLQNIHFLAKSLEKRSNLDAEAGAISQEARDLFSHLIEEYERDVRHLYEYVNAKSPDEQVAAQ